MRACAFVVHPLTDDQRRLLGARLADAALLAGRPSERVAEIAQLRVATRAGPVRVHVLAVPDLPATLIQDQRRALRLQIAAANLAIASGAQAIGLGSALGVVAGRGAALAEHVTIPVTSGHAATAWTCAELARQAAGDAPIGVLGFGGAVGEAVARALTATHAVYVDAETGAARRAAEAMGAVPGAHGDVLRATRAIVSASPTGPTLDPTALQPGTILVDLALPSSLAPGPRPLGVVELAGETLAWPGAVRGGAWGRLWRAFAGYERGTAYACLAEPVAMAALGERGWSAGRRLDPEQVAACGGALTRLGFTPRLVARRRGAAGPGAAG